MNLDVKEEKTELMVMMCMQKAFDIATAAGQTPPKEAIMATAAAEQPQCTAWLHHLLAYVQGSGGNGELLKDIDEHTKEAALTNLAAARPDTLPPHAPHQHPAERGCDWGHPPADGQGPTPSPPQPAPSHGQAG